MTARPSSRFRLAQIGALGAVQSIARRLGLTRYIALLSELCLAAVEGQRGRLAALTLIALRAGRRKLGFGPLPMLLIAEFRASLALPDFMGALADLGLGRLGFVGHVGLTSCTSSQWRCRNLERN